MAPDFAFLPFDVDSGLCCVTVFTSIAVPVGSSAGFLGGLRPACHVRFPRTESEPHGNGSRRRRRKLRRLFKGVCLFVVPRTCWAALSGRSIRLLPWRCPGP